MPSAAITQRKSRIRQDHSCADRSCFCGSSDKRIIWRSTGDFGDTGIAAFPADIFCRSGIDHPCDRCSCVHCCWDCHDGVSSAGRDPDYRYRMPDDGIWTFVTVTDGVVYR